MLLLYSSFCWPHNLLVSPSNRKKNSSIILLLATQFLWTESFFILWEQTNNFCLHRNNQMAVLLCYHQTCCIVGRCISFSPPVNSVVELQFAMLSTNMYTATTGVQLTTTQVRLITFVTLQVRVNLGPATQYWQHSQTKDPKQYRPGTLFFKISDLFFLLMYLALPPNQWP